MTTSSWPVIIQRFAELSSDACRLRVTAQLPESQRLLTATVALSAQGWDERRSCSSQKTHLCRRDC